MIGISIVLLLQYAISANDLPASGVGLSAQILTAGCLH
jgi:hypothetical protein